MARISTAQRRHADYLRLRGLKVAHAYEKKLLRLRRKEVRRVLGLCAEWSNTDLWPGIIQNELREDYLPKWWEDLFIGCGVDMAKSTVRDLNKAKAADDLTVWERMLRDYAFDRSGQAIVSVTGTLKDDLLNILSDRLSHELEGGIEKLARSIYEGFDDLALWQCRRIAQTEGMIAMADAAEGAARSLDIPMTKVWMCSGLKNSRESHLAVDGMEVEMDEPFILAGGELMYPHDTSLGADAGEIINCACSCGYRPK